MESRPDVVDPTTIAEQRAFYEQSMETAHENYVRWLKDFNASDVNPQMGLGRRLRAQP